MTDEVAAGEVSRALAAVDHILEQYAGCDIRGLLALAYEQGFSDAINYPMVAADGRGVDRD